jgi:hypothetical protein
MFNRFDSVFVSCVLFTVTLLCLVPLSLRDALAGRDRVALQALDAGYRSAAMAIGDFGVASLAIILIGLLLRGRDTLRGCPGRGSSCSSSCAFGRSRS